MNSDGRRPSQALIELVSRALLDAALRDRLLAEPGAFAQALGLSHDETQALKRLDRRTFEERVARLRSA